MRHATSNMAGRHAAGSRFSVGHRLENFHEPCNSALPCDTRVCKVLSVIKQRYIALLCPRHGPRHSITTRLRARTGKISFRYALSPIFPLFSNNETEETYSVRFLVSSSTIDFPGSRGVLYGGDARLPDYLRTSQRECVRFFQGRCEPPWSSRVRHGPRKGLTTPLASTSGRHP